MLCLNTYHQLMLIIDTHTFTFDHTHGPTLLGTRWWAPFPAPWQEWSAAVKLVGPGARLGRQAGRAGQAAPLHEWAFFRSHQPPGVVIHNTTTNHNKSSSSNPTLLCGIVKKNSLAATLIDWFVSRWVERSSFLLTGFTHVVLIWCFWCVWSRRQRWVRVWLVIVSFSSCLVCTHIELLFYLSVLWGVWATPLKQRWCLHESLGNGVGGLCWLY